MCKIIVLANQKGGVGKTTSTFNLAYALSEQGKRVLVVDFDPQASLSQNLIPEFGSIVNTIPQLISLYLQDLDFPKPEEFIIKCDRFDCIPTTGVMAELEQEVNATLGGERILSELIEPLRDSYDYILVDTGPSLGIYLLGALTAANRVIIPISPEKYPAEGLDALFRTIQRVRKRANPTIDIEGILFTQSRQDTRLHQSYMQQIRELCGESGIVVFEAVIPLTIRVGESIAFNTSIIQHDEKNPASEAYRQLAREVLAHGTT